MKARVRKLVFAKEARRDIASRADYLEHEAGYAVAERFLENLSHSTGLLCVTPMMGQVFRTRKQDGVEIRRIPISDPFGQCLLFYTVSSTSVRVEGVVHGARDLSRLFH